MILLIILIALPLLEIAVMIKVGQWIGFWAALAIVVGTGIAGSAVLARSGLTSALRVQEAMQRGEPPVAAMLDGALIVTSAILLITPGFVADFLGLVLLVPMVRRWAARWTLRNMTFTGTASQYERGFDDGQGRQHPGAHEARNHARSGRETGEGPVIEGEFERLDEHPVKPGGRRPGDSREPS